VIALFREILEHHKSELWTVPWQQSSYDAGAGRPLVLESLVQVGRNVRSGRVWYEDVATVDVSRLSVEEAA
jgi:hypothetical protein